MYKLKLLILSCFVVLVGCDSGSSRIPLLATNGTFVTPLPANTLAGDRYPVSFMASFNQIPQIEPGSLLESQNMVIDSSNMICAESDINQEYLCDIMINLIPQSNGNASITVDIGGNSYTNETNVTDAPVIGYVHTNASQRFKVSQQKLEAGQTYPIDFVFLNFGQKKATNIDIKSVDGTVLTNVKTNCGSELNGGSACYVHGKYTPVSGDMDGVQYQFSYSEGNPLIVGVNNILEEDSLIGKLVRALPLNIALDTSYDVEFKFKNLDDKTITNLQSSLLTPGQNAIRFSDCENASLSPGESCSVIASVSADKPGVFTALATLYNDDGIQGYVSATSSAVETPVIAHIVQDLPQSMVIDEPYHYKVTFTNTGAQQTATGIRFAHLYPEDFTVLSDTCTKSTLDAGENCHIAVNAEATQQGLQHISSYLFFDQGTLVIASSTLSNASSLSLNSQVNLNFPENMVMNHSYPFHINFTNTGTLNTDPITISLENTTDVTIDFNDCEGSVLTPAESCELSGEYLTTQPGPVRLEGVLNYGSGHDEHFSLSGEVITVPVEGSIEEGLPQNVGLNTSYPIRYAFRNLSDSHPATMVTINSLSTAPVDITSDTCRAITSLEAGEECEIVGQFTAQDMGHHQFSSALNYAEGNEVKINSSTTVSDVVLSVEAEGVSSLAGQNETYSINYRFTNESPAAATNVVVQLTDNLSVTSNTCSATLGAGSHCDVEVQYAPTALGQYVYGISLDYLEGEEINLTQSVKVIELIELDEMVFNANTLTNYFAASDHFNYGATYGFTMQTSLQTVAIEGNPENVIFSSAGSTPLAIELTAGHPINFTANRRNACSTRTMNTYVGCLSNTLPEFVLSLSQDEFNSLMTGTQTGELYVNLTQSNNTHIALFRLPVRIEKP